MIKRLSYSTDTAININYTSCCHDNTKAIPSTTAPEA